MEKAEEVTMVLAPEKPPQTQRRNKSSRIMAGVGILIVLVLAVFGLVALLDDDPETGVGPGPVGPIGPQGSIGPQGTDAAVVGSGTIVSETRTVPDFAGVVIAGEGNVVLVQADQPSVTLRTDDNLASLVTTEVRDGLLYIDRAAGVSDIDPSDGVRLEISSPAIRQVGITGGGSITVDGIVTNELLILMHGAGSIEVAGIDATRLVVDGNGAGLMTVAGVVETQDVFISGTVGYQAGDLASSSATVETNSVSDVVVWVTDELDYLVRGIGDFAYFGSPTITSEVTGAGAVTVLGPK